MNFVEKSCDYSVIDKIKKKWTVTLLNWLNKCIHPKYQVDELNFNSLSKVMMKYKDEMHLDIIDEALLCSEDMESFIKYKYPALKTCYLGSKSDQAQKLFTMTSIFLYHCCVNASEGRVDNDICEHLKKPEQEMILKFCENLTNVEITPENVLAAVTDAYMTIKESVHNASRERHNKHRSYVPDPSTRGQELSGLSKQPLTVLRTVVAPSSTSGQSASSRSCDDMSCHRGARTTDSSDNDNKEKNSPKTQVMQITRPSRGDEMRKNSVKEDMMDSRIYEMEGPTALTPNSKPHKPAHRCMNCGHKCPEKVRCTKCSYRCQQKCCTPVPRKVRKCCRCINWKIYMLLALVMIVLVLTGVVVSILSSSSNYTPLKLDIEELQKDEQGSDIPGLQRELDMNEDVDK